MTLHMNTNAGCHESLLIKLIQQSAWGWRWTELKAKATKEISLLIFHSTLEAKAHQSDCRRGDSKLWKYLNVMRRRQRQKSRGLNNFFERKWIFLNYFLSISFAAFSRPFRILFGYFGKGSVPLHDLTTHFSSLVTDNKCFCNFRNVLIVDCCSCWSIFQLLLIFLMAQSPIGLEFLDKFCPQMLSK